MLSPPPSCGGLRSSDVGNHLLGKRRFLHDTGKCLTLLEWPPCGWICRFAMRSANRLPTHLPSPLHAPFISGRVKLETLAFRLQQEVAGNGPAIAILHISFIFDASLFCSFFTFPVEHRHWTNHAIRPSPSEHSPVQATQQRLAEAPQLGRHGRLHRTRHHEPLGTREENLVYRCVALFQDLRKGQGVYC